MNQTTKSNAQDQSTPAIECKLGWVIVYVDAPTTASDFYAQTFGLRAEFAAPDGS